VNDYPFGHHANEDDQPAPLCPYCGEYHHPSGPCPEDGPAHVPGEEPDDPESPDPLLLEPDWVKDPGASGYPSYVYEQLIERPSKELTGPGRGRPAAAPAPRRGGTAHARTP
jgi:hypothetical protein